MKAPISVSEAKDFSLIGTGTPLATSKAWTGTLDLAFEKPGP